MDQESIVLDLDPRSVHAAIVQANKDVESWEKGTVGAGERVQKSLERMSEMLLKVNDRSRSSMERLTQSIEKQAAAYGRTGVDRLIAERDRLIKKLGDEQGMIDRVTKAYEKMIQVERERAGGGGGDSGRSGFNLNYAIRGVKDVFEGRGTYAIAETANELSVLKGMPVVIGGIAAGLAGLGVAAYGSAKSLGEFAMETENVHLKTGLAIGDVEKFSFAAKMAGQDVSIFDRMMRGLSQAADENSKQGDRARETLARLGVSLRDATGALKPTSEVLLEVSQGLNKLPEGLQRDAAAMDLFKRTGVEAIPVITKLSENIERAKELDLGATEEEVRRWERYHQNITEAQAIWAKFARTIKEPLAATIVFLFRDEHGRTLTLEDLKKMGVNVGKWEHRTPSEDQRQGMLDYLKKIDERRRADEAVNKYYAERRRGPEYRLKEAEEALSKLEKPKVGVSSQKDVEEYRATERRVEGLKALVEQTHKLHEEASHLQDALAKTRVEVAEKLAHPYGMLPADRQLMEFKARPGVTPQQVMEMAGILTPERVKEVQDDIAKAHALALAEARKVAEKVAQKWLQQFDEVQRTAESLAHTLLTKPGEFGRQLATTIHEAVLKPVTEGIGSMVARTITPLIYGSDGQGGIAGIFKGVFGRQDPMKSATDMNTAVTVQNSMAVAGLTAVMAAFMGAGAPAMAAPLGMPGVSVPAISAPAVAGSAAGSAAGALGGLAVPGMSAAPGTAGQFPAILKTVMGGRATTAGGGTASWASNPHSSWSSLKSFAGLGNITTDSEGTRWATVGNQSIPLDSVGGWAEAIGRSPAAGIAGGMLAMHGLLGSGRGTWGGVMEGTAGGALLGFQMGGPLGAAIGAAAGFGIGVGEKLSGVESPENEARRLVKQLYSINIDNSMARQIAGLAQQKYAGHVSIAVRDPDVRKMLLLYSEATGQKMPLSATTPQSASLAEMGGRLYQQASYVNGTPYTFQSSLPALGGYATGTYPSSPSTVQLILNGQSAADLLEGRIVNTVTPGYVQSQWSSAAAGSDGRLQNSAVIQQPGLVIS